MRRLIILSALLALAATACKIETNYGAVIKADGTATLVQEIGMDEEAQTALLPEGTDPFEGQALATEAGARTRQETRGDMTFFIIEVDVASVADLKDLLVTTGQEALLTSFEATVTDEKVTVTATADTTNSLGSDAESFDPSVFAEAVSASFKLTLPGAIGTNNADKVDGNTLTWDIPVMGGAVDIQAESSLTGGGGSFPIWIIAVIGAVALAIVVYAVMQRKKPAMVGAAPMAAENDLTPPPGE